MNYKKFKALYRKKTDRCLEQGWTERGVLKTLLDVITDLEKRIEKLEPDKPEAPQPIYVDICDEIQETGILGLLNKLGVAWYSGDRAADITPSKDFGMVFPYQIEFLGREIGYRVSGRDDALSAEKFIEEVKNAMR